jgi:hypothetical protein
MFKNRHLKLLEWKGSNRKQSARWQHISQLKASAFCIWWNKLWWFKTQQLILGNGTVIWWVTKPHMEWSKGHLSNGREPKSCVSRVLNSKLGTHVQCQSKCMGIHAATSRAENFVQVFSCALEFVHGWYINHQMAAEARVGKLYFW